MNWYPLHQIICTKHIGIRSGERKNYRKTTNYKSYKIGKIYNQMELQITKDLLAESVTDFYTFPKQSPTWDCQTHWVNCIQCKSQARAQTRGFFMVIEMSVSL